MRLGPCGTGGRTRAALLLTCSLLAGPAGLAGGAETWYQTPYRLRVGEVPLDTASREQGAYVAPKPAEGQVGGYASSDWQGHAAPEFADLTGTGRRDLIVGTFSGRFRWYRNIGTATQPRFEAKFEWLDAAGECASVPTWCCVAAGPRLVDLDGDGIADLTSGSYAGPIYWFRGLGNGRFAERQLLTDLNGWPLSVADRTPPAAPPAKTEPACSNLAWVDWNGDGALDLVFGNQWGEIGVRLQRRPFYQSMVARAGQPAFASREMSWSEDDAILLSIGGQPAVPDLHAAPVVVDWNGDGLFDLVSGSYSGAVYLFLNSGSPGHPRFVTRELLLPPGKVNQLEDEEPRRGIRSQVWAGDFNGDGKVDLLVGDYSTTTRLRRGLSADDRGHLRALREELDRLDVAVGYDGSTPRTKGNSAYGRNPEARQRAYELERGIAEYCEKDPVTGLASEAHGYIWVYLGK